MSDDELRSRLRRVDPAAGPRSADRAGTARAQSLLEGIMATPVDTTTTDDAPAARPAASRRWLMPVAAAAAVGAVALSAALLAGGGDDDAASRRTTAAAPLRLTAPASDGGTTMSSCLMFDEKVLADMPTAFGGTVTSVDTGKVVLGVDRWFEPADSDVTTVELSTGDGAHVALDGVEFVEGKRYLVTASQDGTVNTCGYSGEATAEYEASFERAFGSS